MNDSYHFDDLLYSVLKKRIDNLEGRLGPGWFVWLVLLLCTAWALYKIDARLEALEAKPAATQEAGK